MATPGHTPESISVLVYEHAGDAVPYGVLTGDALFIGDVGRPDLLASVGCTADELGRMLYDSVQRKLMTPAGRGPGVPRPRCGVGLRQEPLHRTQSTIGEQRRTNYACAADERGRVRRPRHRRASPPRPATSCYDAMLNRKAASCSTSTPPSRPLDARGARTRRAGGVVLDARDAQEYAGPPARLDQRPRGRPVRRDRRHGRRARTARSSSSPRRTGARGRHPPRPDRLRHRRRLPARPRGRVPHRARRDRPQRLR